MIPGITISMGGNDWIVPPLTLGQLRKLAPYVQKIRAIDAQDALEADDQLDAVLKIVAAALGRNYPDMDEEKVADLLDMANLAATITAVLTGSGVVRAGEAMPVATDLSPSRLETSSATSPPAADTQSPS